MKAETLIAESRSARTSQPRSVADLAYVKHALTALLRIVLSSVDYERDASSTPAVVARALAAIISEVEDSLPADHSVARRH
jgi:hypothetical protein